MRSFTMPWSAQEEEEEKRESMLGALAELAKEKEKLTALLAEEQVCPPIATHSCARRRMLDWKRFCADSAS